MASITFADPVRRLRARTLSRLAGAALFASVQAWALSPEIEIDRLILAAEERIQHQDFAGAMAFLERVPTLKVLPPVKYYFLDGKARFETGDKAGARTNLEHYVEKAGRDGEYYQNALQMLTGIEQAEKEATQQQAQELQRAAHSATEPTALGDERKGEEFDKKVQKLYMGVALKDALVTHINDLLRTYVYMEGKVKNVDRSDRIQYSLSLRGRGELVVTETRSTQAKLGPQNAINLLTLNAFGVNPFVEVRCSKAADSCYLKNPVDSEDWLRIAYDEAGARELALAFERLIKAVQRG